MKYSNSGGTADDDTAVRPEIFISGEQLFYIYKCSPDTVNQKR